MVQVLDEKALLFRLPRWLAGGVLLFFFAAGAGAEDYPALWEKAALKAAAGQVEEAEAMLRQAVQDRPQLAEAWHGLADFLLYYGRNEEAEAAFQGALRLEPNRAESINMLGVVIAEDPSRIGVAETLYRRAIVIDPDLPAPWINLGNLLQDHREKYAEAETAYRWALKLDETIPEAWNGLGNTLNRLGRHPEAEKAFERAIRLAPDEELWRLNLAVMLNKIGRKADAEKVLRDAMEAIPTSWSAALTLGGYLEAGNPDQASQLYRRALDLNPELAPAAAQLCRVLLNQGRAQAGIVGVCRKATELEPDQAEHWFYLSRALFETRDRDAVTYLREAEPAARRLLELQPKGVAGWNWLGAVLHRLGRAEESEQAFRSGIALDAADPIPWWNLGDLLLDQGRVADAEAAFEKVRELDPERQGLDAAFERLAKARRSP